MSFADDAIGFYLQLDNTLSPELAKAEKDYVRFTKSLTKWNAKAFTQANKGLAAVTDVIKGFRKLPKEASKGYKDALKGVQKQAKPITQAINVVMDSKSRAKLRATVQTAVSKALAGIKLHMTAVVPTKKNKFFDTSLPLRQLYKETPQPPDMVGMFKKLPKFAEGGVVPGTGNLDDVLGMLTPGEMVLPKDVVQDLTARTSSREARMAADALANIQSLAKVMSKLEEAKSLGIDPKAQEKIAKVLERMNEEFTTAEKYVLSLPKAIKQKYIPGITNASKAMEQFNEVGEDTEDTYKSLLKKILSPAQFLAFNEALRGAGELVSGMYDGVQQTFSAAQGDQIDDFVTNINRMNTQWGLTRDQLAEVKRGAVEAAKGFEGVSLTSFGEAMSDLAQLRFNPEEATNMAGAIASVATATGTTTDELAQLAKETMRVGNLTQEQFESVSATMIKQSRIGRVNMSELTQQTVSDLQNLGSSFYKMTQEQQMNLVNSLNNVAASLPDGFESSADDIRKLMVDSSKNSIESQLLAKKAFGRSAQEVKGMLASGNFAPLLEDLTSKFKNATDSMEARELAEILGLDMTGSSLQELGKQLDKNRDRMNELQAAVVPVGKGMETITEQTENSTTWFEKFSSNVVKSIGSFELFGVQGVDVMDFFKEFNPQLLLSAGYLARFAGQAISAGASLAKHLIPGLAGMAKWVVTLPVKLLGLLKAQKAVQAASTATASTMTKGLTPATRGLGETIASVGKGIGQFAAGIGRGLGQAVLGFMQGLSGGLMTLIPVIQGFGVAMLGPGALGFAALVAGLFAIAGAMRVAEPALRILGDLVQHVFTVIGDVAKHFISSVAGVLETIFTQIGTFFSLLTTMDAGKILALSGGLLALGPAFIGMGAGMAALGAGLAASAPGIIIFSAAMKGLGALGMGGSAGEGLGGVINGMVEAFSVDPKKIDAAIHGMMGAVKFLGGFVLVSTAVTALNITSFVGDLLGNTLSYWFGTDSPLVRLSKKSKQISNVVSGMVKNFKFSDEDLKALANSAKPVEAAATFMSNYAKVESSLSGAAPTGGVLGAVVNWFTGDSMELLADQGDTIIETVKKLGESFSKVGDGDIANLKKATPVISAMASFVKNYAEVAGGLQDVAPGLLSQLSEKVIAFFGGESPMTKLAAESKPMVDTLATLTHNFAALGEFLKDTPQQAVEAIKVAAEVVKGFNPLAKAVEESGDLIGGLADGWVFSGPMSTLAENMPKFTSSLKGIVGGLATAFKDMPPAAMDNVKQAVEVADVAVTGVAKMATRLAPVADIIQRASERSADIVKSAPSVGRALRAIVDAAGEITGVQQKVTVPKIEPAQVQQAISVQLDPDTTDKPVHERLGETNTLLLELIAAVRGTAGPRLAAAGGRPVARTTGPETQAMAGGNL